MPTAVITGANSGIGHAWARILVDEGYNVFAADVTTNGKIKDLNCAVAQLNVTSEDSIKRFADKLQGEAIDVLLNVAGVMSTHEQDSLEQVNLETLEKTYRVNTFGPLLLTRALLPNLLKATSPRLGFVSSRVGSIADNGAGGMYAYRSSKTALNMICTNLAIELKPKGVVVSILHPGFVITGLDPTVRSNPEAVQPEEAASKLWAVMKGKEIEDSGKFWHREGYEIPW